jgi:N-hydroxyarylamine O-acetyltransferase
MQTVELQNATAEPRIPESLIERVLERLDFTGHPEVSLDGLRALYATWGHRVPFDNVRKLIHMRTGKEQPLPGSDPREFFDAWLRYGTGGTCWAVADAFHALLHTLGFDAVRGVATMLAAPNLPPNHGTVQVTLDGARYLVDGAILCGEPLLLDEHAETKIEHPAWGVSCRLCDGLWSIGWRPLHKLDGFECRLERFGANAAEYREFYEKTRGWSPFNYQLSARLNHGDEVVGAGFGQAVILHGDGRVTQRAITHEERMRLLIETLGMSEEIVRQLPEDVQTPPPPESRTALASGAR